MRPGDRVVATAPVRIADVGGWTDTWFGAPGRVCHVAVGPGTAVEAGLVERGVDEPVLRIVAPALPPDDPHLLLHHAVDGILERSPLDPTLGIELRITSEVPPGASLGTSASVVVAVLAALDALVGDGRLLPDELAVLAHQVETERAQRQAGVQDQWAAAVGGVGLLAIGPYPEVRREAIGVRPSVLDELGERTITVVFGPHDSSQVHAEVINDLVTCSGVEHDRARQALRRLSALAGDAAAALADGDVDQWAEVLVAATAAQADLHPGLVGAPHRAAIEVARAHGAVGWKVNGAGGDGGSLSVVAGPGGSAAQLTGALLAASPTWRTVPLRPATDGVVVRPAPPGRR